MEVYNSPQNYNFQSFKERFTEIYCILMLSIKDKLSLPQEMHMSSSYFKQWFQVV